MHIAILEDNEIKIILLKDAIETLVGKRSTILEYKTLTEFKNNRKHSFDLMISDLHLPDSSGKETAQFLSQYGLKIAKHIVIFSADHELGTSLIHAHTNRFSQVKDLSNLNLTLDKVLETFVN